MRTVLEQLKRCGSSTQEKMQQIIALEQEEPVTLNEDILMDKKAHFHATFKEARRAHTGQYPAPLDANTMQTILNYLQNYGLHSITRESFIRAFPVDESEKAIEIMAEVCAYYDVAFRRFIDNIPMIIDLELLKGFDRTLGKALFQGLGLGEDIHSRCAEYLDEDPRVVRSRKLLQAHVERLKNAFTSLHTISSMESEYGENGIQYAPGAYAPGAFDHPDTPRSHNSYHAGGSPYQSGTPEMRPATPEGYIPPPSPPSIPNSNPFSSPSMVPPMDTLGFVELGQDILPPPNQSSAAKKKKGKKKAGMATAE